MSGIRITQRDTRVLQRMIRETPGRLDDALRGIANEVANDIILSFGDSPPGRTYGNHVASRPGYPPNVDTGALRASIRAERDKALVYHVLDGVEYGAYLELGSENIAPRPFVAPVFEEWQRRKFVQFLREADIL